MPMAIPFATTASISLSKDGLYHFATDHFEDARSMSPQERSVRRGDWSDYPVGVLRQLQALGIEPPPFELKLSGNVPIGAGLSSSASVEVATAIALLAHCGKKMAPEELARLCQRAENLYVGSPCGIMDQFVVVSAVAGTALMLNTRDLSFELLPLDHGDLAECRILVANSCIKHSIAGGEYGARRRELETGQTALLRRFPQTHDLGEATLAQLSECREDMTFESFKRCRHVITENQRVRLAKLAMLDGDPVRLGAIMTESHISERDDFECSTEEIDFLVSSVLEMGGCYGARLTGGGFGGSTVNLVRAEKAESIGEMLREKYRKKFNFEAEIFICDAVDGAIARNQKRDVIFPGEVSSC